jgi:small-conductance mechanosensitive channel
MKKNCSVSFFPRFLLYFTCLVWSVFAVSAGGAEVGNDTLFPFPDANGNGVAEKAEWYALDERITEIEKLAAGNDVDEAGLRSWMKELAGLSHSVSSYITVLETQQEGMAHDLSTLGEAVADEPQAVADQRREIRQGKGRLEGKLSGYRLLLLQSEALHKKLAEQRQQVLTQHFFARGPGVVELLGEQSAHTLHWLTDIGRFLSEESGLELLSDKQSAALAGMIVVALLLGFVLRGRSRRWCEGNESEYPYMMMLSAALGHYAPHLLVGSVVALWAKVTFEQAPYPFIYIFALPLPLVFLAWALLQAIFQGECGLKKRYELEPKIAHGIGRSLKFFVVLAYTGYLIFTTGIVRLMPEAVHFLIRDLFVTVVVVTLLWGARHLHVILHRKGMHGFFSIVLLLLLGVLLAELFGYRNLSYWVVRAVLGTLFAFGAFLLLVGLVREFFSGLQSGRFWWQRTFRLLMGYGSHEAMPWLGWLRTLSTVVLWACFAYVVMYIWGFSADAMQALYDYFLEGFLLGSLRIVPARIVIAIVAFVVLMAVSGWVRRRMEGRWLAKSRMERGSREALVTITGYIGVAVAIIIALSVAGVQFTNLAIIAGALSVGIGFGLQNIVNNFISGLILLFERPVKTGDWIMVGDTEGYVKRISIRSTLLQTFDRADVIVPNSELISGQVTNWMLYDTRGRIRLPIGVAYGSDTQKVKEILLRIADEHPNVISDGTVVLPKVLFLGFGDSALNFELRAFIQNIDERVQVVSDLNFAIDAAFREEGVSIPFPQRDLHIRDWRRDDEG